MDLFEGYVGIRLWDDQLVDDVIFTLLLTLLIVFAFVFRANYRLFIKMVRDVFYVRERLSLFEEVGGNEFVFRNFMTFQALFLCTISLFSIGQAYGYINYSDIKMNVFTIAFIFIMVLLFYLFKQVIYNLIGNIFAEPDKYRFWKTNYNAITGFWGVWLYLPVFWIAFVGEYIEMPILLFVILYVLYRFLVIYKTIRIFHIQGSGFLYIILYLCAQEILPLIFLSKGLVYLYNIIERSAIWH